MAYTINAAALEQNYLTVFDDGVSIYPPLWASIEANGGQARLYFPLKTGVLVNAYNITFSSGILTIEALNAN